MLRGWFVCRMQFRGGNGRIAKGELIEPAHRHLHMLMKSRTTLGLTIFLLIIGVAVFAFEIRNQQLAQLFSATVRRDCAPWDGSAFRVSVPLEGGAVIDISIWQAPDIKFSKTFMFPDDTGQVGNVSLLLANGEYETLRGEVRFEGVSEGKPLAGRFNLKSERGGVYVGQFEALWDDQIALCG